MKMPRGPQLAVCAYEISKSQKISRFQLGFRYFTGDFWISAGISGFLLGFRDISVHARSRASRLKVTRAITEKYRGPVEFIVQFSITVYR